MVTNPGNVPLADVAVNDDHAGVDPAFRRRRRLRRPARPVETWTFEATGTATAGQYENTGTVTGPTGSSPPT